MTAPEPGTSTERRLVVLAGGDAPSGSRVPASEFHRRWLDLAAREAPRVERVALAFDFCHRMVYAISARITGSRWEAEDITQTVFESFARAIDRIQDPARIPGFLKVSAVRNAMHHVKRTRWRRDRLDARFDARPSAVSGQELALVIRQLLDRLPPEERTALILKFGEEAHYDELAELMGVSVATARRRVAAGRERLAKIVGEAGLHGLLAALGRET